MTAIILSAKLRLTPLLVAVVRVAVRTDGITPRHPIVALKQNILGQHIVDIQTEHLILKSGGRALELLQMITPAKLRAFLEVVK